MQKVALGDGMQINNMVLIWHNEIIRTFAADLWCPLRTQ